VPSIVRAYQLCGVFAELERSIIQERVKAGLATAHVRGKTLGRPRTSPKIEAKSTRVYRIRITHRSNLDGELAKTSTRKKAAIAASTRRISTAC
jgi:DNA invertase Pin-like site-specific DNA recombinase